jgi:hypothetical protein
LWAWDLHSKYTVGVGVECTWKPGWGIPGSRTGDDLSGRRSHHRNLYVVFRITIWQLSPLDLRPFTGITEAHFRWFRISKLATSARTGTTTVCIPSIDPSLL